MKLLLVGLIFGMLIYGYKCVMHVFASIKIFRDPTGKMAEQVKVLKQTKWVFVLGGIEHWIILATLIGSTIALY